MMVEEPRNECTGLYMYTHTQIPGIYSHITIQYKASLFIILCAAACVYLKGYTCSIERHRPIWFDIFKIYFASEGQSVCIT